MEIRNVAIIAHVDHGKTTLTDAVMCQTGMVSAEATMDTNAIEQERGITIYAKNASFDYKGTKVNIVDTPGHADFGSEVERVLRAIDAVLLVVDAQDGPMPQTKFVLKKSLELGLQAIVIINKIDKLAANPDRVVDQLFDLFVELGATNKQLDFPIVYSVAKLGISKLKLTDPGVDMTPLLDTIMKYVPPAPSDSDSPMRLQSFNLGYDDYLGRLAICRVYEGVVRPAKRAFVLHAGQEPRAGQVGKLYVFRGQDRVEATEAFAGDIVMVSGFKDIDIGESICETPDQEPLPAISVDEPTITLDFLVNNSPFAGRDGKLVTSRHIRERLEKELEINVGLQVDFSQADGYQVSGRGELHIAILLENMRRKGFELQVSQPRIITKIIDGKKHEPFEEVTIDVPDALVGTVIEKLGKRKGVMQQMVQGEGSTRLIFEIPTRGLLGYRGEFIIDTRGEGILSAQVIGFKPDAGEIARNEHGSMISMMTGRVLAYALENLQIRGDLYIEPNMDVYEGMVIGTVSRGNDLRVNPIKGKKLTNMRKANSEITVHLTKPIDLTLERGLELIAEDEYLEITPNNVRLRKKYLTELDAKNAKMKG